MSMRQTIVQLTTGTYVLKKSMPSICVSPCAQNWALSLLTNPSGKRLILNAQVHGRTFIHGFLLTTSQTSILTRVSTSTLQVSHNLAALGPFMVSSLFGVSVSFSLAAKAVGVQSPSTFNWACLLSTEQQLLMSKDHVSPWSSWDFKVLARTFLLRHPLARYW